MANKDKTWFETNITLDSTKIKLAHWDNGIYLIPTALDFNDFFCGVNNYGQTMHMEYNFEWVITV